MGLVVNSGLSTAEGLIEAVRDGTPADESDEDNFDPGVTDKRLLVLETEYRQVLSRSRRDGNTLAPTLRQAWDGGVLRTMTRSRSRLTATDPHIAIIGHITPGEFRAELRDSDLSGGSVNRMLMCLSRRTKLLPNLGNVPAETITKAAADLSSARKAASERQAVEFANQTVWARWEEIYRRLNRDRPESRATDATARSVSQVLRLALVYALLDGAEAIGLEHLNAADALWKYCEHSAKWLFSTYALEQAEDDHRKLVKFIEEGGPNGRTRTEISTGYFQGHRKSEDINRALAPLIHNGHVVEEESDSPAGGRKTTRYVHQKWRNTRNGETGRSQQ